MYEAMAGSPGGLAQPRKIQPMVPAGRSSENTEAIDPAEHPVSSYHDAPGAFYVR